MATRRSGSSSAQRLAASQRSAPHLHGMVRGDSRVLNALRHHRGRHVGAFVAVVFYCGVLNALRHHRGRHVILNQNNTNGAMCSTPCGITEVGTLTVKTYREDLSCAQRLAASQRSAPAIDTDRAAIRCAQRLAASQRSALFESFQSSLSQRGAQRLAASQRSAPLEQKLSALRSDRCSTPCGITEVGTGRDPKTPSPFRRAQRLAASQRSARRAPGFTWGDHGVLNALRHHRGRHGFGGRGFASKFECSTPCGITEVGTPLSTPNLKHRLRCSTPCGITEVGTRRCANTPSISRRAQRLAASQRSARAVRG